jgi:CelD/BcsL family acetyltransferase involved in cellulose biosynthesis
MAVAAVAKRLRLDARAPAIAEARDFRFAVARDLDAFDSLEGPWNALADRCADSRLGFQSFAWLRSWLINYPEPGRHPHVLLGYCGEQLALAWPLGERRRFGVTILEFLGEPMSQYHDVLVEAGPYGEALVQAALAHLLSLPHDLLRLRRVRDDSPLTPALRAAGAKIGRAERAPFARLAGAPGAELLESGLSGKARQNRRRRLRRLAAMGEITQAVAGSPACAEAWVATALAFKRQWSLNTGCYAPAAFDPRFELCFRDAARTLDPSASLRVFAMLCDGIPIGIDISFAYRDRLFAHVLAPDPALAKFGVGTALADASIRHARDQGYQTFDLLAPADRYKLEWSNGDIGVNDFLLAKSPAGAMLGAARAGLDAAVRNAVGRAPLAARRALISFVERNRLR